MLFFQLHRHNKTYDIWPWRNKVTLVDENRSERDTHKDVKWTTPKDDSTYLTTTLD